MRFYYTIFLFCFSLVAHAQQDVLFSQFFYQKTIANPGAAGSQGIPSLSTIHRQQWVGVDGAPQLTTFSAHSPLKNKNMGVGLELTNDVIGPTNKPDFKHQPFLGTKGIVSRGMRDEPCHVFRG